MSLRMSQLKDTSPGAAVMKELCSAWTVAPALLIEAARTRTVPPEVTLPDEPCSLRRLVSVFTRTCASLNFWLATSYVMATAENGELKSDAHAQRSTAPRAASFIRARPSSSARPARRRSG